MNCKQISGVFLLSFLACSLVVHAQKMSPEEFIVKHLESIGESDTRASIKTKLLIGEAKLRIKSGRLGETGGPAVMASEGEKHLIGMTLGSTNYPHEKLGYDGKNLKVAYILPGIRSTLGDFFVSNPFIFREGLIGGVLSTAWPLFDDKTRGAKIEYNGLKKINGVELFELNYIPRKGSDFSIKLYFDADYRHVRSEYLRILAATQGARPEDSARRSDTRYQITEEFSDFKKESGMMFPHSYKLNLTATGQGISANQQEWEIKLVRFAFNQQIPPESYDTQSSAK